MEPSTLINTAKANLLGYTIPFNAPIAKWAHKDRLYAIGSLKALYSAPTMALLAAEFPTAWAAHVSGVKASMAKPEGVKASHGNTASLEAKVAALSANLEALTNLMLAQQTKLV